MKRILLGSILLTICLATCLPVAAEPTASETEDVVLQWNRVLGQTLEVPGLHPGTVLPARSFAMLNLAMFDALNSIEGGYRPYLTKVPGSKNASKRAAAARAARDVLVGLYPSRQAVFDAELADSISGEAFSRVRQGQTVGRIVAARILEDRASDGWDAPWTPYQLDPTPGNWQGPTPFPGFAVFTNIPGVRPFALSSPTQFLPSEPPPLTSVEYANSFNEVKDLGSASSASRTPEQTASAFRWAIPPVSDAAMFSVVFSTSVTQGLSSLERARLAALSFVSFHDALLTTFTSQYTYGRWRPVTAIERASEDGNDATIPDAGWDSLLGETGTPPHPSYASNASSASASIARSLELFYGTDDVDFQIDFGPEGVRTYSSFSSLTDEVAHSRIFGGVHFRFETDAGQKAGRDVALYVSENFMTPTKRRKQ
ncbi:MAG: vanadium-dependent haloperoxidase [Pyrinomonadaceae bacterium]